MAAYYFDTSALVKRYVQESGTKWVEEVTDPSAGPEIFIVRITGPEIISALFRKVRMRELEYDEALRAAGDFKDDFVRRYRIVEVTVAVANHAMTLAQRYNLRGYDSVQLAAAMELQTRHNMNGLAPFTFLSADNNLNRAAESEGLEVDNPNAHV